MKARKHQSYASSNGQLAACESWLKYVAGGAESKAK
jgi:hypothetical protein